MSAPEVTEHQVNWWGTQRCRRCNPEGLPARSLLAACPDCDGTGWTEWAALTHTPWSEIVPRLWIGGHDMTRIDYSRRAEGHQDRRILSVIPDGTFDLVISAYRRPGQEPQVGVEHHEVLFHDGSLTVEVIEMSVRAARIASEGHRAGKSVLIRCQAGLNRSSLIAGLALVDLGVSGRDAVQLIRSLRSPWALCNDEYAAFLESNADRAMRSNES